MNKKIFFLLAAILCVCASCDLEPEFNNQNSVYYMASKLCYNSSKGDYFFLSDDSVRLEPASRLSIPDDQIDTLLNKRYYISFQLTETAKPTDNPLSINLLSMQMMYEGDVEVIENAEELKNYKNEMLTLQQVWISGSYINLITTVMGSGSRLQNYHLIYDKSSASNDTLYLTLRYDKGNDKEVYNLQNALSYDIKDFMPENDKDSTVICFNYNATVPEYNTLYLKIKNQ